MWNIIFVGFVLCLPFTHGDVSHLGVHQHPGYPSHKPDHPLELPQGTTNTGTVAGYPSIVPENPLQLPDASNAGNTVTGYPRVVPENPLQIPEASSGNVRNQLPDSHVQGSSTGGVLNVEQLHSTQNQGHKHEHHYHGEDGKYNHQDDGSGWDIRKSVPGEPGQDYPVYESVPTTSFTCKEKAPGYYADEEARCQVFRICTTNSVKTYNSFLCANGSLFSQRSLTCDWWMNVDCESSSDFYYKNQEIGKMPTGQQLMYQVSKMLEAPNKHPYSFTQHDKQFVDQTIADNQIQGTGRIQDVYLPVKQPIVTTTKKYYPTVPSTTTTTTTTTPKPILVSNFNKVDTNKFNVNQNTFTNVKLEQDEGGFKEHTIQNVKNEYIPPVAPTIDQSSLSNVKTQQNKVQIGQSSTSGLTGYDYQKPVPVSTSQVTNQVIDQQTPSVTVTKEQTQIVTNSQKTTHVFQNVDDGPNKISLLQNGQTQPQANTANVGQNIQQHEVSVVQQHVLPSTVKTFTGSNVGQTDNRQQEIYQQAVVPSTTQTFTGSNIQSQQFVPDVTKEQAFQQIDNIQTELQQITKQQEQQNIVNSGLGILTPRKLEHTNLAPDFGQNFGSSQGANINYQNIPQGFSHQGVQPNVFIDQNYPTGGYIQNQGYDYQQPNFHEQNLQNFNYHGQQSGDNYNLQVSKDGSAQNYNGESLSQHSNGQTHSSFSGHNVAFQESTKVDIVPSLGFHLNDDYEKNSYISAVLSGLIHDGPSYQTAGSSNFGQNQFPPSDVRFSSYQGPSSYLAPQASVQRLPSDSGYYR